MIETPVHATTRTPLGWVAAAAAAGGLLAVTLPQADEATTLELLRRAAGSTLPDESGRLDSLMARLRDYYAGLAVEFDDPLDMRAATPFQQRVWQATRAIARGTTTTYGQLAKTVGAGPESARAVGRCMATNPWPPLVPCHRVLGQDGSLTGFGGGIAMKRRMLEMEGVLLPLFGET